MIETNIDGTVGTCDRGVGKACFNPLLCAPSSTTSHQAFCPVSFTVYSSDDAPSIGEVQTGK